MIETKEIVKAICKRMRELDFSSEDASVVRRLRDDCQALFANDRRILDTVDRLRCVIPKLQALTDDSATTCFDVAALHLRLVLRSDALDEASLVALLTLLNELLLPHMCRSATDGWAEVVDLRTQLLFFLADMRSQPTAHCDRVKLLALVCLRTQWLTCDGGMRERYFAEVPALGHFVFVLLTVFNGTADFKLNLECLKGISNLLERRETDSQPLCVNRVQAIAHILAGILMEPWQKLANNTSVHHLLVLEYLSIVRQAITLTLSDGDFDSLLKQQEGAKTPTDADRSFVVRDSSWFTVTGEKVSTILQKLISILITRQQQAIRESLVDLCFHLLTDCRRVLLKAVGSLLDALVSLRNDSYPCIAEKAVRNLNLLKSDAQLRPKLESKLEDGIFTLCGRLPMVVREQSVETSERAFQQLLGYLQTLDQCGMSSLCRSEVHVARLIDSLYQIIEFDFAKTSIVSEELSPSVESIHRRLPLCNITHTSSVYTVMHELGRLDSGMVLADRIMDRFHESSVYEAPSCVILSYYLEGAFAEHSTSDVTMSAFVDQLLEMTFDRLKSIDLDVAPEDSIAGVEKQAYSNDTLLACSILATTARCAALLGSAFRFKLQYCLYDLLLLLSSSQPVTADATRDLLCILSKYCGYDSVSCLLADNCDYLISLLALKLRHPSLHPRAPRTLMMFLEQCNDPEVYDRVAGIVDDVIAAVDIHHELRCILYVKALLAFVKAVRKWFRDSCDDRPSTTESLPQLESKEDVDDGLEEGEESTQKMVPRQVKKTNEVLKRTKHLISSIHLPVRLVVMALVSESLRVLASFDDQLLPMVHQNWSGVLARFREIDYRRQRYLKEQTSGDGEAIVAAKAFDVIVTMADVCNDFIARRVADEFWPSCRAFLEAKLPHSHRCGSFYQQTAVYRLQKKLLEGVRQLFVQVGIKRCDSAWTQLTTVLQMYANDEQQPQELCTLANAMLLM